ncbi:MAG: HD domain-containing phosphohydrolase [Anaerolineaceae bacterium]
MSYTEIVNNAALLLVLSISQSFIQHQWIRNSGWGQIVRGIFYGVIAVGCMLSPMRFSEGVIFDGRSVVLSIGGLFGGPLVATIASIIASAYRISLGGTGMLTGVGSIVISAASGIFYRYYIKEKIHSLNFLKLFVFGLCVHSILIIWFITIPGGIFLDVIQTIAAAYLSVFPIATAILGSVIVDQEKRLIAEEHSRINEQKYRTLLETAPDIIMTLDREGVIHFINQIPAFAIESNLFDERIYTFLDPSSKKQFKKVLKQVFLAHKKIYYDFSILTPEKKRIWYAGSFGFMEEDEKKERVIVIAKDITQQRMNNEIIQQRNKEIRALYEINRSISSSLDIEKIYDAFYEGIIGIIACDGLTIFSYSPEEKLIHTEYYRWGNKKGNISELPVISNQESDFALLFQTIDAGNPIKITTAIDPMKTLSKDQESGSGFLVPIVLENTGIGIIEIFCVQPDAFRIEELHILQALAAQIAVASNNAKLYKDLRSSNENLQLAYDKTLEGWNMALQMREKETAGHTRRVANLTMQLADKMGIPKEEKIHIWRGALLHDIGKLVIPDHILHKPGPLDDQEWEIIHNHPVYAYEWLSPIEYLRPALDIPYSHHEHWDGSGYPQGLSGNNIPLSARMFAVVDVYDALTSDRPYRKAWSHAKTIAYIKKQVGSQFDPSIVKIFLELFKE